MQSSNKKPSGIRLPTDIGSRRLQTTPVSSLSFHSRATGRRVTTLHALRFPRTSTHAHVHPPHAHTTSSYHPQTTPTRENHPSRLSTYLQNFHFFLPPSGDYRLVSTGVSIGNRVAQWSRCTSTLAAVHRHRTCVRHACGREVGVRARSSVARRGRPRERTRGGMEVER